jgi:4-amino-4-deoxy-L-arabinose transferase-like glycosyltransferase
VISRTDIEDVENDVDWTPSAPPTQPVKQAEDLWLLAAGVLLRIAVFVFLAPLNRDPGHLEVIKYIVRHHTLPPAMANAEAFQPPLYYLLATPFYALTGSAKWTQALSLILCVTTLLILYRLLYHDRLIDAEKPRRYALLLACFLPQFVQFGLYVSNDALAICLGALLVLQAGRYAAFPNVHELTLLGLTTCMGLLTKATFLAFLPVLFALILFVHLRHERSLKRAVATALAVVALSTAAGSYRFVRSYRETGNPFFSNLQVSDVWVRQQQASYRGAASFVDIDFAKLLHSPSVSPETEGSYPLLLFGTFWYQHIPESNFVGSSVPLSHLAIEVYILALIPTAVFLAGLCVFLKGLPSLLSNSRPALGPYSTEERSLVTSYVAIAFLLANCGLIFAVTARYHVWSVMQGRLLFPSFAGLLVSFGAGAIALMRRTTPALVLKLTMTALVVCFGLYFSAEVTYQALLWLTHRFGDSMLGPFQATWRMLSS